MAATGIEGTKRNCPVTQDGETPRLDAGAAR